MKRIASFALIVALCASHPVFARGSLISVDVHDADIADVIALLSAQSGKNIVADGSLHPERVTLHLRDVRFEDALDVLVRSHGLQVRRQGGVLIVGSADSMNRRYDAPNSDMGPQTVVLSLQHAKPDDLAKEITDALPAGTVILADKRTSSVVVTGDTDTITRAKSLIRALDEPAAGSGAGVATRSYRLHFMRPDDVIKQLRAVEPDGVFVANPEQNAVLVSGNDEVQSGVRDLISSVDVASPQVLFEVKVADVTPENDQSNFGIEFGGTDLQGQPVMGSTTYAFKGGSIPVSARLNALISKGRAEILATPKLVTINNREADLLIGQTYPIAYNTSVLGGQNVQFVDIGVKLRMTPTIGPDGMVTAELHPEYSELQGFTQGGYPIIANRKIDSTLRVRNNETIVLGGLMRDVSDQLISKVPGLADLPVLGKFFQNKQMRHERDEIVFMITPHVIFPDRAQAVH